MKESSDVFDVLEKDKVLVNLPKGKHSVVNPSVVKKISAQKGPTCWYYSARFLTPRFGDGAIHHKKERAQEKALSTYRIALTAIDARRKTANHLTALIQELFDNTAICVTKETLPKAMLMLKLISVRVDQSNEQTINEVIKLANSFGSMKI